MPVGVEASDGWGSDGLVVIRRATGAGAKGAWPLERRPYIASKNPLGRHRFSGQGADPSDICYLCNSYIIIRSIAFRTRLRLNYGNSCTLDHNFGSNGKRRYPEGLSVSQITRLVMLIHLIWLETFSS